MSIYTQTVQGIYTPLPSAVRTTTQTISGKDLIDPNNANARFASGINPEASGIVAYLNVTAAPGIETIQLKLQEQDPASGSWVDLQGALTTATTVTGMIRLKLKQAIVSIAASASGVQVQDTLPAIWRIVVVHSGAGNWTYSLGVVLYN